ncbi:unnamed protein product [Ectocarpus sp. 4 AP-2014]
MDQHRQVSRSRPIAQGCCSWAARCSHVQAKWELVARNDERSREVFRWLSSLTAQVELEFAERTAEDIARREVAQQCAREGARRKGAPGGSNKRNRKRLRALPTASAAASAAPAAGNEEVAVSGHEKMAPCLSLLRARGEVAGRACSDDGQIAAAVEDKRRCCCGGDDGVADRTDGQARALLSTTRLGTSPVKASSPSIGGLTDYTTTTVRTTTTTSVTKLAACMATHHQYTDQQPRVSPPEPVSEVSVQRREWGKSTQQQRQQVKHAISPVGVLEPQMQPAGGEAAATASTQILPSRGCSLEDQRQLRRQQQQERPFVVVGTVGEFGDRVLLLPTTRERRQAMAAGSGASVPLTWTDSKGFKRTATLIQTKAKPKACNPLLMLATLLAWMREFSPGVLPESNRPVLPEALLAPDQASLSAATSALQSNNNGSNSYGRSNSSDNNDGVSKDNANSSNNVVDNSNSAGNAAEIHGAAGRTNEKFETELSPGAAWLLAHMIFGRGSGGQQQRVSSYAQVPHRGEIGLNGGEAAALSLLPCPLIGWCPRPEDVMEALSEGGGSLRAYSISPSEFDIRVTDNVRGQEATRDIPKLKDLGVEQKRQGDGGGGRAQAAADELVRVGYARKRAILGLLTLTPKMEDTCKAVLKIFLGQDWDPQRDVLARITLGLIKAGIGFEELHMAPMTMRMCPAAMPIPWESQQARNIVTTSGICRGRSSENRGISVEPDGRMSGLVGDLCVKLHLWCYKILRPRGGSRDIELSDLNEVTTNETNDHPASPLVWSGAMAQALGLLGGAVAHSSGTSIGSNMGGTVAGKVDEIAVGNGGGGHRWIAALSREKRTREAACFRVKDAASRVVSVIGSIVEGLQKQKTYEIAVMLLRLMVRSDQGLAGSDYREASPDLVWAADWVTNKHRGYAYTRLAINLKHLKKPGRRQLETVMEACDDDGVQGGDRVELRERYDFLHKKFGDSQDTPVKERRFRFEEEVLVVNMDTQKEGNQRSKNGGRKLYFDTPVVGEPHWGERNSLNVEEVLLRERYRSGGWLGLHCESSLNMFLMVLLLWEEVFDDRVQAALPHVITSRPLDMQDKFFCSRREGLPRRLRTISRSSDEQLWLDVGQRYDRFRGVVAIWCDWNRFPKQQVMEICAAFGGRRLSDLLSTTTTTITQLRFGFPDVVLWRPKSDMGVAESRSGRDSGSGDEKGLDWGSKTHFGLGWEGYGQGWEVQVVEVKSKDDITSHAQKAWLMELENARVPAMVARVLAEKEASKLL